MDFYKDLSRQLLNNSTTAHKRFTSSSGEAMENSEDADYFFNLAVKSSTTQMAYLEHNRVNHLLLKSAFESFQ
ncbi:hypothetical protein PUN49_25430 [Pseudomonas extremaustralis]|jgi:hypothetical protein|uniref:Uncharacterized protein n=1 Tax=Pseudomonas extremaustralis TaxID=359110 RepID=A0A5C5QBJ5_9PSED|nr:hypothetical protein [Pseudomonas extremaustralis]EZI25839.1 hypothetical protein PE143B_0123465 [Pseudomonas extremaustralis 14-3 substr. 14-3b]MDB1111533.1 hypothetical protein [Pseudomonas extremaustralis]MDF3135573.1 hypothetical protein [Pseudomonas extremaustralis]MDG2970350.1 hypothetical protein [Pseudomonas extremaustralis]MDY7064316.1 hypothetical protein [Pseudomonas extremaustralis]